LRCTPNAVFFHPRAAAHGVLEVGQAGGAISRFSNFVVVVVVLH
jgi:hypothetical protein